MLKSTEHGIFPAHKCKNANNCWHFNIYKRENRILDLSEPTKSRISWYFLYYWAFKISCSTHEKSFITSGSVFSDQCVPLLSILLYNASVLGNRWFCTSCRGNWYKCDITRDIWTRSSDQGGKSEGKQIKICKSSFKSREHIQKKKHGPYFKVSVT